MMKRALFISAVFSLITSSTILAHSGVFGGLYNPGPYLHGQIGWGRVDEGDVYRKFATAQTSNKIEHGGFTAWRIAAGYSFTENFSMEGGYSYYPPNKYSFTDGGTDVKSYAIDFVGKFILPLTMLPKPLHHFSIYGKAGGAFVHSKINHKDGQNTLNVTTTAIRPAYGAGIIFSFDDNFQVDASWSGFYGNNRVSSSDNLKGIAPVPTGNLFSLGISYKITGIF